MCRDLAPILVTWGLRDYSIEPQVYDADPDCEHVWGEEAKVRSEFQCNLGNNSSFEFSGQVRESKISSQGQFCQHCNAWKGSLGLEPTPELFIQHIVQVFRGVWRVLHKSGTIWVNMGDSYAANRSYQVTDNKHISVGNEMASQIPPGLKPKDLIGIPWRVALALQADGWYLRSALPWVKRSAMPESATDRPASALEYIFLLSKSQHYFFDMDAVRVAHTEPNRGKGEKENWKTISGIEKGMGRKSDSLSGWGKREYNPAGRNFRNTDFFYESITPPHGMIFCGDEPVGLDVNPQAMKEAHFATFPERLVEPCLKAGMSERGCCPECLAPWERIVEKTKSYESNAGKAFTKSNNYTLRDSGSPRTDCDRESHDIRFGPCVKSKTIGWKPSCKCKTYRNHPLGYKGPDKEISFAPIPCTCLDPFFGSGTVAVVAEKHRRNWIGIELSKDYCELAKDRIQQATKQKRLF